MVLGWGSAFRVFNSENALGRESPRKASANGIEQAMAGAQGIGRVALEERDPR